MARGARLRLAAPPCPRPCRKVAIPVPESYSWEQFVEQVRGAASDGWVARAVPVCAPGSPPVVITPPAATRPQAPPRPRRPQVKKRLRLTGIRDIYLASVRRMGRAPPRGPTSRPMHTARPHRAPCARMLHARACAPHGQRPNANAHARPPPAADGRQGAQRGRAAGHRRAVRGRGGWPGLAACNKGLAVAVVGC